MVLLGSALHGLGRLLGGNLATLCTLAGTRFEPSWDRCIMVVEDVGEPAYKIDRMMTSLSLSSKSPIYEVRD